jgi:hypothetical protein
MSLDFQGKLKLLVDISKGFPRKPAERHWGQGVFLASPSTKLSILDTRTLKVIQDHGPWISLAIIL